MLDIVTKLIESEDTHPEILKSWQRDLFAKILGSIIGNVLEGS
jgi:phage terminase large subunit-like protein